MDTDRETHTAAQGEPPAEPRGSSIWAPLVVGTVVSVALVIAVSTGGGRSVPRPGSAALPSAPAAGSIVTTAAPTSPSPASQQPPLPANVAASPASGIASKAGDPAHGKVLFNVSCFVCHSPVGAGVPGLGPTLRESKFVAAHDDAQLVAFIAAGRQPGDPNSVMNGTMPPKGANPDLDGPGLADVVAYIRTLQADARQGPTIGSASTRPAISSANAMDR